MGLSEIRRKVADAVTTNDQLEKDCDQAKRERQTRTEVSKARIEKILLYLNLPELRSQFLLLFEDVAGLIEVSQSVGALN